MKRIHDRIGAILGSDSQEKIVKFLGFGTYIDDRIPIEAVGFMAEVAREMKHKNPCLQLDNGAVVYGCECWWGHEEKVKQELEKYQAAGYTIKEINIEEVRRAFLKQQPVEQDIAT